MGNQIAPLGVDYTQANALGDTINLPYFYASFSNNLLSGSNKIFDRISVPGFTLNKKRAMTRSYSQDDRPIVPPWGQRRLKRSSTNNAEISRAQQEDEVMRGIYRVAQGLEKCQQEFYFCMENSAIQAATETIFDSPTEKIDNMKQAVSGLNRYKIALSEGNTMCKLRFPECVSGQLAVAVSEDGSP